jgi:hypothetical protein
MNLQNLHEGQVVKNYKELCALLDITEKIGNSRKSQIKEIERHFKFKKEGHLIIVEKVYDKAEIKMDGRKLGNRSIYVDDVSVQLLNYLVENKTKRYKVGDSERTFLTARNIFQITGMINSKYLPTKQSIKAFIDETPKSLEIEDLNEFFARTESKMREILMSSLKNLDARLMITYERRHLVSDKGKNRISTEKEEDMILDIKDIVMNEMLSPMVINKNLGKLFFQGKLSEFYLRVNELVFDEMKLNRIQYGFLIGHGERLEHNFKTYKKEFEELTKLRFSLNGKFANFTNKDAERKYLKSMREYEEAIEDMVKKADENIEYAPTKPSDNWVDNQFFLTDKLIKLPKY